MHARVKSGLTPIMSAIIAPIVGALMFVKIALRGFSTADKDFGQWTSG